MSDDWDKDGIRNGDEIKVVSVGAWTYIEMKSHPLREHTDSDGVDDYTEVQRGSDPLYYDVQKVLVDNLCDKSLYSFEPLAADLREDGFKKGLIGWSAIVNGVWNKKELYRDLLIDYYSTYMTQDVVDEATLQKKKETLIDFCVDLLNKSGKLLEDDFTENVTEVYNINHKINMLINKINNGSVDADRLDELNGDFKEIITEFIMYSNKVSEEAVELRYDVHVEGVPYVKKYLNRERVKKAVGSSAKKINSISNGFSFLATVVDIWDTWDSLSKVEANKAVFAENMQAIEWLGMITTDDKIQAATDDVMELLAENYIEIYANAIQADVYEVLNDAVLDSLARSNVYVLVVVIIRDGLDILLGTSEDLKQMYRILCYSDMCDIYSMIVPMQAEISMNGNYYYCTEKRKLLFIKYLTNLAHLRVLGEKEYYKYLMGDGWLTKALDKIFGTEDIGKAIENRIDMIRRNAEGLNLHLSSALNYGLK